MAITSGSLESKFTTIDIFNMTTSNMKERIGIIVSGGPAPGINSVIASVVFAGHDLGYEVFGFQSGFEGLVNGTPARLLTKQEMLPVSNTGGSILGTARFNPLKTPESKAILVDVLEKNNIKKLVVIGGEGSATVSLQLSKEFPWLNIAHVPKTIDNDLELPNHHPSFGFETARFSGTRMLRTLCSDAKTTRRWFIIKTMGRKAGFLALGLGIASGADLVLIPEQYENRVITVEDLVNNIMECVTAKYASGVDYGCVVIAEGLLDCLNLSKFNQDDLPLDGAGRISFSEFALETLLVQELRKKSKSENLKLHFTPENIGYVLRCRHPVPFDIEYTRLLGYGAVKFLHKGERSFMIAKDLDFLTPIQLETLSDGQGGIKSRKVDINSELYKVAQSFMSA